MNALVSRFLRTIVAGAGATAGLVSPGWAAGNRPNVILLMADDLGYGDTGFNGHRIIQTPHLDALARRGVTLTHFYAGNSVCSPTRGTCLTGRHHDRYGIYHANSGHLPAEEITVARMLKAQGYTTGHFGKWHLGTLSPTLSSKGPGRQPALNFSPPWERDYDTSLVTESAVSTWDPGLGPRAHDNPFYENGRGLAGDDLSLRGGAARVVTDRVVPFIQLAAASQTPFLAVVWFHAPHEDIAAGPSYLERYADHGEAAHYYGCITEMDDQIGRIVRTLDQAGVSDDTLIFFCSDNGPESIGRGEEARAAGRRAGTTAGLRGRKRALHDGGVRVPALAVWPRRIPARSQSDAILSTLDYFPTLQKITGYALPDDRPIDGQDILPILIGEASERTRPIAFRFAGNVTAWIRDGYKLILPAGELYDLSRDRSEARDVAADHPDRVAAMRAELRAFFADVQRSHAGGDYPGSRYRPTNEWKSLNF